MKPTKHLFFLFTLAICFSLTAQKTNPNFNEELSKTLNADSYGMKMYTMVLLYSGSNTDTTETRNNAFASHMKNINHLLEIDKLVVSGPVGANESGLRGIFVLNTEDIEEAKKLLAGDEAIQKQYLKAQYLPYYGSAALPMYLETHDKIWKEKP